MRITAGARARSQADRDTSGGCRIVRRIGVGAAIERIGTGTANKRVIACVTCQRVRTRGTGQDVVADAAGQNVVIGIAGQCVVIGGTGQVLDAGQRVALGIATRARSRAKVDRNSRCRGGVISRVRTRPASERIGARTANERVVTGAAIDRVHPGIAGQAVSQVRADNVLDICECIALGIATRAGSGSQIDRHRLCGGGVINRVGISAAVDRIGTSATVELIITGSAIERVVAILALQRIGTGAAGQRVGEGIAAQRVIAGGADHAIYVDDRVAGGIATGRCSKREIDIHRRRRGRIINDVVGTTATVERVATRATTQRVVTKTAGQRVGIGIANKQVVITGTRQILEAGKRIALRVVAGAGAGAEIDRHATG